MYSVVDQIKERVDIVDLAREYLTLQKAGVNFKALCPFHNEKTPSFFISPERQIFKCFGCGEGGSVFDFLIKLEGYEFPEALRILAQRAGVELTGSRRQSEFTSQKIRLYEITELAAAFFEKQLLESDFGKRAREYLKNTRGLYDDTIRTWRVGYAPQSWDSLKNFLLGRGYTHEEVIASGLIIQNNAKENYDRFRSRITFPIFDVSNQVVGFSARLFETGGEKLKIDAPKYINTPQTLIYDKSRILYGIHRAKQAIRKTNRCILVEGNMDVIASHQAGVETVVASSGTALTENQLRLIKRYTDCLDLCFDFDFAGDAATVRGINLALMQGLSVNVITTDQKDPADYVRMHGAAAWQKQIENRVPMVVHLIDIAARNNDVNSAYGKKQISSFILPFLTYIQNSVERAHWISYLAGKLGIPERSFEEELARLRKSASAETTTSNATSYVKSDSPSLRHRLEETFLTLLLRLKNYEHKGGIFLKNPVYQNIHKILCANPEELFGPGYGFDKNIYDTYNVLALMAEELWKETSDEAVKIELSKTVARLARENIKEELFAAQARLKQMSPNAPRTQLTEHLAQINRLTHELQQTFHDA